METCKDKSQIEKKKSSAVLVSSGKSNAIPINGRPKTSEIASRSKSSSTLTPRCSSPKRSLSAERRPTTPPTPITSEITSRYKSTIPSSPRLSSINASNGTQRSHSVERKIPTRPSSPSIRRSTPSSPPSTPSLQSPRLSSSLPFSHFSRPTTPTHDTTESPTPFRTSLSRRAPDGLWPSVRGLSASLQSDTSSDSSNKSDKASRNSSPLKLSDRNKTPTRENSHLVENSHVKPIDQQRWPGMIGGKISSSSIDLTDKITRITPLSTSLRGFSPSRSGKPPSIEVARPSSSNGRELTLKNASHSSENATSTKHSRSPSPIQSLVHPSSPSKASIGSSYMPSPIRTRPFSPSSPSKASISSSYVSSPIRIRPSSPSSPSRASISSRYMSSPVRTRPSSPSSPSSASPRDGFSSSPSNYFTDAKNGKRSPSHIEDAHQLRLLHGRDLQWRFVNAKVESMISKHSLIAEDKLYNTWAITSQMYDSIIEKRINVQNLRQEIASMLIINEQVACLEDWNALEAEHGKSLLGTMNALKASTLRLPLTDRARADVRDVKNAISSAVDVMHAMGPSVCYLLPKVKATYPLMYELSEVIEAESFMLTECRELVALTAALQVQESSLEAHLLQLKQQNQLVE